MGEEVKAKKRKTPDARVYACAIGGVKEVVLLKSLLGASSRESLLIIDTYCEYTEENQQ